MDSGRSHRVTTGSVRQVARSCTRRALIAWRLGRALRRWPECGLSRPLGVSLSYELLLTRRALSLRSLLRWSPDPDRLVGNAVTFKSRYCTSTESKPLGNGDAVLLSRTPVRRIRTHVSNRWRSDRGVVPVRRRRDFPTAPPVTFRYYPLLISMRSRFYSLFFEAGFPLFSAIQNGETT